MRPRISISGSVCPSVGRSVGRLVRPLVTLLWKIRKIIIFEQIIVGGDTQDKSHVITSSYNHFIITRTHRWPYGPCFPHSSFYYRCCYEILPVVTRVMGSILLCFSGTCVFIGVRFVSRLAPIALVCVLFSIVCIFIGNQNGKWIWSTREICKTRSCYAISWPLNLFM